MNGRSHRVSFVEAVGFQTDFRNSSDMNIDKCNVTWNTPSDDSLGSMPLGNGDFGANVWVTDDGVIHLYLSKTDAWDESARLVKLGELAIRTEPSITAAIGRGFVHELRLSEGAMLIRFGGADAPDLTLRLWADVHRPVIWLEAATPPAQELAIEVQLSTWRTEHRELPPGESDASMRQDGIHDHAYEFPDQMLQPPLVKDDQIGIVHRNQASVLPDLLKHQQLDDLAADLDDPLINRTFGCALRCVHGRADVTRETFSQTLRCHPNDGAATLAIVAHCDRAPSLEAWCDDLGAMLDELEDVAIESARDEHERWWEAFWQRSFIEVTGDAVADRITQVYQLQRYLNACAGRGAYPIKFNGSIFTVEGPPEMRPDWDEPRTFNPDYRRWGGGYWFQNTRLIYWMMLGAGDTDMMHPWFDLFEQVAPLCRRRVAKHLGIEGLFFPETMTLWGTYRNDNYGYDHPDDLNPALTENRYIRRYWQGGLELATIMLEHLAQTGDEARFERQAYPIIRDLLRFYQQYYDKRDESGTIHFEPSQSLETWQDASNPTPDIAGLRHVIDELLALPADRIPAEDRDWLVAYRDELPPIPTGPAESGEGDRILPAERYDDLMNMENCDLYAVFPYPHGAIGGPLHDEAKRSWPERRMKGVCGWFQDALHAAMLGKTDEAADFLTAAWASDLATDEQAALAKCGKNIDLRFPAFFGPNFDWVPDQDHTCVNSIALQKMLLQTQHGETRLLPAWPQRWNVHFKLPARDGKPIEARYKNGELTKL